MLSAWSMSVEGESGGPLADVAEELARVGSLHQRGRRRAVTTDLNLRGLIQLALLVAADPRSRTGQALLLRQIIRTIRAIHDAHTSTGHTRQATRLRQVALDRLGAVQSRLPDVEALTRDLEDRASGEVASSQDKGPVAPLSGSVVVGGVGRARSQASPQNTKLER